MENRLADSRTVGERLRKRREDASVAVKELCMAVGITPLMYERYERGEIVPRGEVRRRLADYWRTTVAALFFAAG